MFLPPSSMGRKRGVFTVERDDNVDIDGVAMRLRRI